MYVPSQIREREEKEKRERLMYITELDKHVGETKDTSGLLAALMSVALRTRSLLECLK